MNVNDFEFITTTMNLYTPSKGSDRRRLKRQKWHLITHRVYISHHSRWIFTDETRHTWASHNMEIKDKWGQAHWHRECGLPDWVRLERACIVGIIELADNQEEAIALLERTCQMTKAG
jgi:hypothetical protein